MSTKKYHSFKDGNGVRRDGDKDWRNLLPNRNDMVAFIVVVLIFWMLFAAFFTVVACMFSSRLSQAEERIEQIQKGVGEQSFEGE